MEETPTVSIVTLVRDWPQFFPLFKHHYETIDYPQDKLEWIIVDDSNKNQSKSFLFEDNVLYIPVKAGDYLSKIDMKNDPDKHLWNYYKLRYMLPNGFKRDYAVGMTSSDYIIHFNFDCVYHPKTIKRKLRFLTKHKLDCLYCKSMLCYDIYGKKLYKTENKVHGYESTLFHTKKFWENKGFTWSDIDNEAVSFYYNQGNNRLMENYYDCIQLLSVHNINKHRPIEVKIDNLDIHVPALATSLIISEHPVNYELSDLLTKEKLNVVCVQSEIAEALRQPNWNIVNIELKKKEKEKVIIRKIKESMGENKIGMLLLNLSYPVWDIFSEIDIPYVLLESYKNKEQMHSILQKADYLIFQNIYIKKNVFNI